MELLGPLKFHPLFKNKIWGGNKIKTILHHDFSPLPNCGELWSISGVPGNESIVANGPLEGNSLNELLEVYMGELVGESVYEVFQNEFPLLIKFIDANDWLSIQVHPDDELAEQRGLERGKTEMWYILHAEENAKLIKGFSKTISKTEYESRLVDGSLHDVLNYVPVVEGETFYIPAKKIHALGPGILLTEIQQSSDTTYRIYDWNRVDENGKGRQLHIDEALDSIDFKKEEENQLNVHNPMNTSEILVDEHYFTTQFLDFNQAIKKDYEELDSFVIYIVTKGSFVLRTADGDLDLGIGDTVLLPAITTTVELHPLPKAQLLEVSIRL